MTPVKLHRAIPVLATTILAASLALLTGCGITTTQVTPTAVSSGFPIQGRIHGGQQPISGAHIYLMAAGAAGYGTASVSLLAPDSVGGQTDSIGTYVTTDSNGAYSLPSSYTCNASQFLYLLALGGNPGLGGSANNSAIALMAPLGQCPTQSFPFIYVNEMSTVASAYALAGFLTDATHLSTSGTPLAITGLGNAMQSIFSFENISTGQALALTPSQTGIPPQATLNTLADILAPCVNSDGTGDPCNTLFANAKDLAGNTPSNTLDAIINIAHNPAANVPALYNLVTSTPPFMPTLSAAPNDWTVAITFYVENLAGPYYPAIDANGDIWIPGFANNTLTELDTFGDLLSGQAGFSGANLNEPVAIAIDASSNAWIANYSATGNPSLSAFNSSGLSIGSFASGPNCFAVAVDASQNIWTACNNNTAVAQSPTGHNIATFSTSALNSGIAIDSTGSAWTVGTGSKLNRFTMPSTLTQTSQSIAPASGADLNLVAIDSHNNVWFTSGKNSTIGKFSNTGTLLSPATGYTGGGLSSPAQLAIDGSDRVFVANRTTNSISVFANNGTPITPATGYLPSGQTPPDPTVPANATGLSAPHGVAIDGSGNVWVTNFTGNSVTEFLGLATPVVTPMTPTTHGQRP
jgi:sugar lactone lactonase YvrE